MVLISQQNSWMKKMRKIFEWIKGNWFFKRVELELGACETENKKTSKSCFGRVLIGLTWSKKWRYHSGHEGEHALFQEDKDEYKDNTKYIKKIHHSLQVVTCPVVNNTCLQE